MFKIGWFSSGRDQAAIDLLQCVLNCMKSRYIHAKIAYVFCDRENGESKGTDAFLSFVRQHNLLLLSESSRQVRRAIKGNDPVLREIREEFDKRVLQKISQHSVDVIVFVGYMLVASDILCVNLTCLNLHPALPGGPIGTWQEVVGQLIASGAQETGLTMHIVTPALDRGPAVTYLRFPLPGQLDIAGIRQAQVEYEQALLAITLKHLAERRFFVGRSGVFSSRCAPLENGLDLTAKAKIFLSRYKKHFK